MLIFRRYLQQILQILSTALFTAACSSTKQQTLKKVPHNAQIEKRKVRKSWQNTRDPNIKSKLSRLSKDLKSTLCQIEMANYLQGLTATEATDYSLWKATKIMYCQTSFASALKTSCGKQEKSDAERANSFANHLSKVFRPYPRHVTTEEEDIAICSPLVFPFIAILPITKKRLSLLCKVLNIKRRPVVTI